MRSWFTAFVALTTASAGLVALMPRAAHACASCACGDPTLTTLGADQAFDARLRVGVVAQAQRAHVDTQAGEIDLTERRMVVGATYAPSRRHVLSLAVPLTWRSAELGGIHGDATGLGGVEARWRAVLWRDRSFAPRWLLMSHVGVEAPPWLTHDTVALADDDWLPPAATTGFVGVSMLAMRDERWSGYLSLLGRTPIAGEGRGEHVTAASTGFVQWQPTFTLALRVGADARFEAERADATPSGLWHAGHAGAEGGVATGLAVVVGPDVVWSPSQDVVVSLGGRAPVLNTDDILRAGPSLTLALTMDL